MRPTVGFDLSHAQQYTVDPDRLATYAVQDRVWYSYVRLRASIEEEGLAVRSLDSLRPSTLDGLAVLVLVRPTTDLSGEEAKAVRRFVERGGGLLLVQNWLRTIDDAKQTQSLAGFAGIDLLPLGDKSGAGASVRLAQYTDFYLNFLDQFDAHPVTDGVRRVAFHESCGVAARGRARVVASGSNTGGVAVANVKRGRVAVVGDTEVFSDLLLGVFDNERLARNLVRWLAWPMQGGTPTERLAELLASTSGVLSKLERLTHIGADAVGDGPRRTDLFDICASFSPEDILGALFDAPALLDLETSLLGDAPPAPSSARCRRILNALGFHDAPEVFGRRRMQELVAAERRRLDGDVAERPGACLALARIHEEVLREMVLGYGYFLDPDPVGLLGRLIDPRATPERATMGAWALAAQQLLGQVGRLTGPWADVPGLAAGALGNLGAELGQRQGTLVGLRNALAHGRPGDLPNDAERFRAMMTEFGADLLVRTIGLLPEVVRLDGVAEDSHGRRHLRAVADLSGPVRIVTNQRLSTALSYWHFARTAPSSVNPVLVQRGPP